MTDCFTDKNRLFQGSEKCDSLQMKCRKAANYGKAGACSSIIECNFSKLCIDLFHSS